MPLEVDERPVLWQGRGTVLHYLKGPDLSGSFSFQPDAKGMKDAEMEAEMDAEIGDFLEDFNQPTFRGMRVNGVRVATWLSRDGWSGDTRPDAEWLQ